MRRVYENKVLDALDLSGTETLLKGLGHSGEYADHADCEWGDLKPMEKVVTLWVFERHWREGGDGAISLTSCLDEGVRRGSEEALQGSINPRASESRGDRMVASDYPTGPGSPASVPPLLAEEAAPRWFY